MRWPVKELKRVRPRFALFPTRIDTEWVWLERYYVVHEIDELFGVVTIVRFNTYQGAVEYADKLTATY